MKNYHQNLGKGLGIKIGVMKRMFKNPKIKELTKRKEKRKKMKIMKIAVIKLILEITI